MRPAPNANRRYNAKFSYSSENPRNTTYISRPFRHRRLIPLTSGPSDSKKLDHIFRQQIRMLRGREMTACVPLA